MEQTPLLKDQQPPPQGPPPTGVPPTAPPPSAPPPYQGGPYQPPPQPPTVVTSHPVVVTTVMRFTDAQMQMRCPNCHRDVMTRLEYSSGLLTWLVVLLLCVFGLWCGCCLIPLCVDGLKDVDHVCPNCNYTLGKYKRLDG